MSTAAALTLPRAEWPAHPHYPAQVLLVRSHESFRYVSRWLLARAEAGEPTGPIERTFRDWKSAMRGHEAYEEHKLYPYLEARWGLSCAPLQAGHHALSAAEAQVLAACEPDAAAPEAQPAASVNPALVAALRHHDAVLHAHLDAEEAVVIPALLALSPAEFATYCRRSLRTLLAQLDPQP